MSHHVPQDAEVPSLEKLRVLALIHIPHDASRDEARSWLQSQKPGLSREAVSAAVEVHLEDDILEGWRNERNPN